MGIRNLFYYLNTTQGRKWCQFGVTATSSIFLVAKFLPITFGLDLTKEFLCGYRNGKPIEVTDDIKECFSEAMKYAELEDYQNEAIEPFISSGLEIYSLGSLHSFFGGIMAIPLHFIYEKDTKIQPNFNKVGNVTINSSNEEAKDLYNSLILSKEAKIFAITREFKYLQSLKFYELFLEPSCLYGIYQVGAYISKHYNFYAKHVSLRISLYSLVSMLGLSIYCIFKDASTSIREMEIDEELAKKNELLRKGGLEFYEKQLQRNLAMRKLMGSSGPKKFSTDGDEIYRFRNKHFPLVERRQFYEIKDIN